MGKAKRIFVVSVVFSLALHCGFLFLPILHEKSFPPIIELPIELETLPTYRSLNAQYGGGGHNKGKGKKQPTLKELLPIESELISKQVGSGNDLKTARNKAAKTGSGKGTGDGLEGGWITSVGADEFLPIMQYVLEVWKHIDENLNYPEEFTNFRISGKVNVRMVLNPDGTMEGAFQRIESDHNLLEAYVLSILLSILESPYIDEKHRPHKKTAFNLTFEFQTETERVFMREDKGNYFSHALLFKRTALVPSAMEKAFNNIMTHYFPPIFLLGPMVYIDVIRAYEFIQNYGKPSQLELEEQRLQYLTEKLKTTIKKKK